MRRTTGLLLTAALLIPGAARAQPGFPRPYDPFGPRPGAWTDPRTRYTPGLPPDINDILHGQDSPRTPFGPGRYDPRNPGLPGAYDPYFPGAPTVGVPVGRPVWKQLPPQFADPHPDFRDPTWWNTIHDKKIPDVRNLPQVSPPVINIKPPVMNIKDLERRPNPTPPPFSGCSSFPVILGVLAAAIGAAARGFRRSSDDRK
jgi:hypothetical protein